jgi:hypothetical protein
VARQLPVVPVPPIRGQEALRHGWKELHDEYAAQLT